MDGNSFAGLMKKKDSVTDYISDKGNNLGNFRAQSKRGSMRIDDDEFTKGLQNSTSSFGGGLQKHIGKSINDSLDQKIMPRIHGDESYPSELVVDREKAHDPYYY